jgi:hypothetical protein
MFRGKKVLSLAPAFGLAYIVLIFIAVHLLPSRAAIIGWIAGILLMGFILSSGLFLWQWHRDASKALGVKVTSKNSPPGHRAEYVVWCRENGVSPLWEPRS